MNAEHNPNRINERLVSLDTLRGFDMLWITGGGTLVVFLAKAVDWGWLNAIAEQMEHVPWAGFHFYDLIFPLFMFISGVAIPYAITGKLEKGTPKRDLVNKVTKRMLTLVIFGLLYNGAFENGFADLRYASVLGQIGLAYFFAALIVMNTKRVRTRLFWLGGILLGIALLQLAVPVPGFGAGEMTKVGSINSWIDQHFLPGKLYGGTFDPEGLLCIVSATAVTLMGSLAGTILRDGKAASARKAGFLVISGAALVVVALLLSTFYPIIKAMWTVPFDLLTAGVSFLLLSVFYYIIDVKKWRGWILFFQVIGLNSITIYMVVRIFGMSLANISKFFLGWLANPAGDFGMVILTIGGIAFEWLLLYYLYKKRIFLRV